MIQDGTQDFYNQQAVLASQLRLLPQTTMTATKNIAANAQPESAESQNHQQTDAPAQGVQAKNCATEKIAAGAGGVSGPLMGIAAPPTAQAEGWISVDERLPEPGTPVLLDIGKKYPIRAMWAAKHTVQAADDDTDWGEYVEEDDMYYAPEGWYEWNQCEENHWRVTETPRAWMPLPPASAEGVEHG